MKLIFTTILTGSLMMGSAVNAGLLLTNDIPMFSATHGAQGTGNYKGKRDKHEKPGPLNERKKKGGKWKWLRR